MIPENGSFHNYRTTIILLKNEVKSGEKLCNTLLEADEGEHSESEASEDDDVAQVLHRLDHRANDRLEA